MNVTSNWVVDSVVQLHEAVQEVTALPSKDVAELLDEEKCFSLTKPEGVAASDGYCCIRLSYKPPPLPWPPAEGAVGDSKSIKAILLHSEARVVEVCMGPHGEYLKTVHGERLGQYEDTEMCACLVELNPPRQEVILTLKHTYNPECVWVFGLIAVTTQDGKPTHAEARFSSTHLSSVLKDKDVSVSKDAARFLHLLESYNASNHAVGQINENNQLALMSMFLGSKMPPGMLTMGGDGDAGGRSKGCCEKSKVPGYSVRKVDSDADNSEGGSRGEMDSVADKGEKNLENTDGSDLENRLRKLGLTDEENNHTNLITELASEGNENNNNNNTSGCLPRESATPKMQKLLTAANQDGMIEKLLTLIKNAGLGSAALPTTPQHHNTNTQAASLSPPPLGPGLSLHCLPTSPPMSISPQFTMMQTLMESLARFPPPPHNSFQSTPPSSIPGPTHSTPRPRKEDSDGSGCNEDTSSGGLGLEGRERLLKEVENIVERKFTQMEERITKRVEQKLEEQVQRDSERLERIEEHLSKLCEHLLR